MAGGAGNDTYYVEQRRATPQSRRDNAGTDQVFSSVSFSLAGQYIENLTLTGSGNTNGTSETRWPTR